MGRHPRGGRNWERFGPDLYLAGVAINESVSGIEATGVQTSSKHCIGNEQETQRVPSTRDDGTVIEAISANIDDQILHELYLWPFANAVQAGTAGFDLEMPGMSLEVVFHATLAMHLLKQFKRTTYRRHALKTWQQEL